MSMLSSDRMRNPHAEEHESDTALWERLRSEANRRSTVPEAPQSEPAPRYSGYRAAPGHVEESDDIDPYARYREEARLAEQAHYEELAGVQDEQLDDDDEQEPAQAEAQFDGQGEYGGPSAYDQQTQYDARSAYDQQAQYDAQSAYDQQAQYDAQSQYAQQAQYDAQSQYAQQAQYGAQPQHEAQGSYATTQPQQFAPHHQYAAPAQSGFGQVPAYGHAQSSSQGFAAPQGFAPQHTGAAFGQQTWDNQAAHVAAPSAAVDHDDSPRIRSRWMTSAIFGLVGILGVGAAGYQFVLVPRQQQERAVALAELQARQQKLIDEQAAIEAAAAKAEAEQRAATEAALARADEAAAAAGGAEVGAAVIDTKSGAKAKQVAEPTESRAERKSRERHERRAARSSKKSDETRSAKSAPVARTAKAEKPARPTKAAKKAEGGAMADTDNNDPLFGL